MPRTPPIRADDAWDLIHENVTTHARVESLSGSEYAALVKDLARNGIVGAAVYDAVIESMPLIAKRNKERGAVLIVSDGADTASSATLKDVQAALRRSQAFVYAIAIDSPERRAINRAVNPTTLREITNESGARTMNGTGP